MRVLRRFLSRDTDRGVTATVGVALLLVIVLLGTATVIGLGGTALQDVEDRAQSLRSEQAMTVFDSQAARVALGNTESQTVALGNSGGGTYDVRPDAGQISIIQVNCDDHDKNEDNDLNVTGGDEDDAYILSPTDLGALVYESGDTTIAYQGGGVWRVDGNGNGMMVSPPEFHYRGSTLTLPVIKTRGSGAVAGTTRAVVQDPTPDEPPRDVFPNASATFPSYCLDNGEAFSNPATAGRILVRVESQYATAWGRYFEQRTEGNVTYPGSNTVQVELIALKSVGEFTMPNEGGSISVSGAANAHAVSEFTIRLRPGDQDSANFNNLQWTLYADEGDQQFEIHLKKSGSDGCADGSTNLTADATIYYSNDNGNTYHGWHGDGVYDAECADLDGDSDDEIYFDITFVGDDSDTGPTLSYQSLSQSDLEHFSPGGASLASPTLDGHGADWESVDPTNGTTLTTDQLINHYFAELPQEFDLTVDDKNSDTVSESISSGVLRTTGAGRYVTYLHVTENTIEVELR